MINWKNARKYCCDKISLIENYEQAKRDLIEVWDLHHRKEDEGYSVQELIDKGMYYDRPANELIFLKHKEHVSLHKKGKKGYWLGKHHSEETRRKMSEAKKGEYAGEKHPMYGKTGEKHNRSKPIYQIDKNTGEIIKTWVCAREVQRKLGISFRNISGCCLGKRKSAGGYFWRYAG